MHSQGGTACFIEQVVVMHDSMQLFTIVRVSGCGKKLEHGNLKKKRMHELP